MWVGCFILEIQIITSKQIELHKHTNYSTCEAYDYLDKKHYDYLFIGLFLNLGHFELGWSGVHHDLCLVATVDDHTQDVFCVSEAAAAQEEVLTA